jgi:hypothetical protein
METTSPPFDLSEMNNSDVLSIEDFILQLVSEELSQTLPSDKFNQRSR